MGGVGGPDPQKVTSGSNLSVQGDVPNVGSLWGSIAICLRFGGQDGGRPAELLMR